MKKTILQYVSILLFACFLFSGNISAQTFTNDELKAQMLKDWERGKAYTNEYLNTMPADKYSYRYKPVDSLRSFAMQMLHLATANVFLMATATDQMPLPWASFGLEKRASAQSRDSVVYYVNASYDFAMNAVQKSDPSKWKETKKLFGFETTRFALMNKTFEHQTHHRGQTTIYIRMNDIAPPQEKLF
ncbi:MAG TPA: DinB family protein [Chitinophagaceae bacterium]|nr:DinB family protein [Chitinophagaceae bacterium]